MDVQGRGPTIDERMHFIRMRNQGYSVEEITEPELRESQRDVNERVQEISRALSERRDGYLREGRELTTRVEELDPSEVVNPQNENIRKTLEGLQQSQKQLEGTLELCQSSLSKELIERDDLNESLHQLKRAAKVPHYPFENGLYEWGQKGSNYISQSNNSSF